jgi:hypothetical protein
MTGPSLLGSLSLAAVKVANATADATGTNL